MVSVYLFVSVALKIAKLTSDPVQQHRKLKILHKEILYRNVVTYYSITAMKFDSQ